MSLEATLARTNELLEALLTRLATAEEATQELGTPEVKSTRGRKKKEEVVAAEVVAPTTTVTGTVAEATRYFVIEKHNTVYEQKPGMPGCSIDGAVEVDDATYEAKKVEFAAKVQAAIAASQGLRSSSVSGVPLDILATFSGG